MKCLGITLAVIGVLLGTVWQVLKDPKHKYSIGGLSPRFDGRDSDSQGDYFQNSIGLWLYHQEWIPESVGSVRGGVLIVHGYGEHIGRYSHVIEDLNAAGFAVFGLDHQGHGKSEGDRVYVEKFGHYSLDVIQYVQQFVLPNPVIKSKPLYILGHSMGGLIAVETVAKDQRPFKGLILSSPALTIGEDIASPTLLSIADFLSRHLPKLPLYGHDLSDTTRISHRPEIALSYKADSLVYHGPFIARFSNEFLRAMKNANSSLVKIDIPVYGIHSKGDRLTTVQGMYVAEKLVKSKDKTIKYYDPPYQHELLHEHDIRKGVVDWLVQQAKNKK